MKSQEKPLELVRESVIDVIEESSIPLSKDEVDSETRLLGSGSGIDSLDLVNIVVVLEDKVEEEYGESVTIANEDAMSRAKSPFINVRSLAKYVQEITNSKYE
jgi:acyl carrier protein